MSKKLPIALSKEEFERILKKARVPHHKVAFILGFCAGMRISEIVNLQKENINMNEKYIRIVCGKGGKDRIVPLPKGFGNKSMKHIPMKCGVRSLQMGFKNALKDALIETDYHFHSLRHGFATHCINTGMNIHQVQLLLGHTNVATTSIYLRANPKDALKSYEENF